MATMASPICAKIFHIHQPRIETRIMPHEITRLRKTGASSSSSENRCRFMMTGPKTRPGAGVRH